MKTGPRRAGEIPDHATDVTRMPPRFRAADREFPDGASLATTFRRRRYVTLDAICSSHIDVVGKLESYGVDFVASVAGIAPTEVRKLLTETELFCRPNIYPMLLLDFSTKAYKLWEIIQDDRHPKVSPDGMVSMLPSTLVFDDFNAFRELFLGLCITKRDLEEALSNVAGEVEPGTVIAIHTDWFDQFNPRGQVEFYGIYELWHPFLLRPYLDRNSLRFLREDIAVGGIATDAPTLEPPVYYCKDQNGLTPNVIELQHAIKEGIRTKYVDLPSTPFLHIDLLCNQRLIIESLDFARVICPASPCIEGDLHLIPMLADSTGWESVPVRAMFVPSMTEA